MSLIDKYILEYSGNAVFDFSKHISTRIFDVEIDIDVFEYNDQYTHREKARAVFKNGDLKYECDFCDIHSYESGFYPIILDSKRFICFRKALYGFTLLNADTLSTEYEYFPKSILSGGESFIIADTKQLDTLLIFEGCYWGRPYECFLFDYDEKLFLNVSQLCGLFSLDEIVLQDDELILYGTDESESKKQFSVSKENLMTATNKYGRKDF